MRTTTLPRVLVLLAAGMIPVGASLRAQQATPFPAYRLQSSFEVGARLFTKDVADSAEGGFELFRQYREGPVLQAMRFELTSPDRRVRYLLGGDKVTERDQNLWFRATELGRFDLQLQWDRAVHTYGTRVRFPGVTLTAPRPDATAFNSFPLTDPVRILWDPIKLGLHLRQSERLDLSAEYLWLEKSGSRPMGMAFGSPGGNFREILEPIDQTTHQVRISEAYATDRFQAALTYNLSRFVNHRTFIEADNPLQTADQTNVAATGRSALPPGNVAHTIAATAALRLPEHTRVSGTFSYGWRRQSADFLQATRNTAIADPLLDQIPARLKGDMRTLLLNLSVTSVPTSRLTLTGRFRHYELQDKTDDLLIPAHVVNDATFEDEPLERERFPYTKDNASFLASWRLIPEVKIGAGYAWEAWERAALVRNVRHTDEHTPQLRVDVVPTSWLTLRTTGSLGWRRDRRTYEQVTATQLPELRRFDQADRNRRRLDAMADVNLTDNLTVSGSLGWARDKYPDSQYGTQRVWSLATGGEATWAPSPRLSADISFMREEFKTRQQSRNRIPPALLDNITYDWVTNNNDLIETFSAGIDAVVIPDRLDVGGRAEVSTARLSTRTFNPLPPTGGTAAQNTQSLGVDFPNIKDKRTPISGYVRYRFSPEWSATARYTFDHWSNTDWRSDDLLPANLNSTDRFLGNDYLGYNGQFVTLSFAFRPRFLRAGRSAL